MQNIIDSTDKLFIAYKDNDIEFASQYFPQLIREYPELENPQEGVDVSIWKKLTNLYNQVKEKVKKLKPHMG